jgi:hypothetical protein
MTKAEYLEREKAWKFFHDWERERQFQEFSNMSYEKRSQIARMLFEHAVSAAPEILRSDAMERIDFNHKCHMAELRLKLKQVL